MAHAARKCWERGAALGDPDRDAILAALEAVADERGKTVAQVAINWCLCQGSPAAPVVPLVGARTPRQARDNLGAAGWRLSAAEVAELEAAARKGTARMTQNAFQSQ